MNFVGPLKADEMRQLLDLLLRVLDESVELGMMALTKVEFVEPDTLEYRYWCGTFSNTRVNKMYELWSRMNQIHPVRNVDGIPYPWLGPSPST